MINYNIIFFVVRIGSRQGRIQDFKMRRAEGGAKTVGVFRVKNHDFTPKNYIFSNFGGGGGGGGAPGVRPC